MHMSKYENLKDILCKELDEITRKGEIDRAGLDDIYKLTSAIVMVDSLIERNSDSNAYRGDMRGSYDGMSNRMGYPDDYSNRTHPTVRVGRYSMDYNWDGSYDDYSEARGRDSATGRYVSRDNYDTGYSRHTAEQKVTQKLEDMLDTTQDPHIREVISQAISKLK